MAKKKINLTSIKALQPSETIWDTDIKGFGCRCQKDGKYFILKYSINQRQRFFTIGALSGELTPDQARAEAEMLRGMIRKGIDPMAMKEADAKIPLVKTAFDKYLDEVKAKRSPRTYIEYKRVYEKFIKSAIGNHRIDAIARADIAKLHNSFNDTPYQSNRILALLSSFFSWCDKHGHRTDGKNPCRHIDKYKESSRERLLSEQEIYNLSEALKRYEENHKFFAEQPHKKNKQAEQETNHSTVYITATIRLLILTGARCSEILTLKWQDVDFERKLIRLQKSKTGQKTIYLSAPALQLLSEIPRIQDNPFVICGKKEGSHLVNIKDPWGEIRKDAGLSDVRIHDLRHNFASTAVGTGHHLKVIGSLLGHANTKTTERYAHLANDPLQTANEAISNKILDAMTNKPNKNNVVTIKK
jgi:integrase